MKLPTKATVATIVQFCLVGTTHLEYLYVTLRRNSAHRVTEIVTIFGRILYVFTENSVRFCTVVFDGPAPPLKEFFTAQRILHPRVKNSAPTKELTQRIL
jgi:hypothetical protein